MMALNPASGPLEIAGLPDADSFPSVCMDYESVVSFPSPPGATGTWAADITVLPHPVQPVSVSATASVGAPYTAGIANPTLTANLGGNYSNLASNFINICNTFRMLYCGVTIDLDASGLIDVGSVVAGQFPLETQVYNFSRYQTPNLAVGCHVIEAGWTSNFPGKAISQLPGAYMGLAKHGVYMPIKIDPGARWVPSASVMKVLPAGPNHQVGPVLANLAEINLPNVAPTDGQAFPFYGDALIGSTGGAVPVSGYSDATGRVAGDVFIGLQQTNMGHIVFYNMNPAASLTVKVKWGVEMRVEPTSILAPAMTPSACHDALALEAYSDIAGSLPWAYPSEYNANGKILDMIRKAWNVLRPALSAGLSVIPHPAAQLAGQALSRLPSFERPASQNGVPVAKAPKKKVVSSGGP